jgi:hypothetical protein
VREPRGESGDSAQGVCCSDVSTSSVLKICCPKDNNFIADGVLYDIKNCATAFAPCRRLARPRRSVVFLYCSYVVHVRTLVDLNKKYKCLALILKLLRKKYRLTHLYLKLTLEKHNLLYVKRTIKLIVCGVRRINWQPL